MYHSKIYFLFRAKFVGEKAKEGQSGIMSRQKLREQAELHNQMLKTKNKKERMKKQLAAIQIKQPKVIILQVVHAKFLDAL